MRWNPALVRAALAGHSLLGLAFGALIYQICLTGTLSVFAAEFRRWEQPAAPYVTSVSPEGYAHAAAHALGTPGVAEQRVLLVGPKPHFPRFEVRLPQSNGGGYADENGHVIEAVQTPWTDFVVHLHDDLHIPYPWGSLIVGLSGAILLALIVTGVCAHSRIFRDAFYLRRGGSEQLSEADLHNRMSVWALPFHATVALTGTILALVWIVAPLLLPLGYDGDVRRAMTELIGPQPLAQERDPSALPDITSLIRKIETDHAPAKVNMVDINQAGTMGQLLRISATAPADLTRGEDYYFAADARFIASGGYAAGPVAKQMIGALTPLHFGKFGGFPIRLIYGVLGMALCAICATGINIWLIRQRNRGRSSEVWARVWTAVVWGQPLALVLSATGAGFGSSSLPLLYVVFTLLTIFISTIVPLQRLRSLLIGVTAAGVASVIIAHIFVHGLLPTDPIAPVVNAFLAMTVLALTWMARRT